MKVFKGAKWDADAENNTFQELFKNKKKGKFKSVSNIKSATKKIGHKFEKKIINNMSKNKNKNNDHVNLIGTSVTKQNMAKNKNKKHKTSKDQADTKKQENITMDVNNKIKKGITEVKKSLNTTEVVGNAIKTKKQKFKTIKRSIKTLPISNFASDDLVNLVDSPLKQKKLKISQGSTSCFDILPNNTDRNNKPQQKKKKPYKNKTHNITDNLLIKSKVINKNNNHKEGSAQTKEKKIKNKQLKNFETIVPKIQGSLQHKKIQQQLAKLKEAVLASNDNKLKRPEPTLRQKMMEKLKAARFRFINEQIYTTDSKEAQQIFQNDPQAFNAYHDGYRKQVKRWPLNPLDVIINSIKKMPKTHIIADFGCGDARLSKSVNQTVHSFDLVAVDESVVACDMSKVPLGNSSVDIAVYCLSLMGTNLRDYLLEANRVLKVGGVLKIAEVESRFENIEDFIKGVSYFGFKNTWKDQSNNLFYFLDFKKERDVKHKNKLPTLSLLPCLYKKR